MIILERMEIDLIDDFYRWKIEDHSIDVNPDRECSLTYHHKPFYLKTPIMYCPIKIEPLMIFPGQIQPYVTIRLLFEWWSEMSGLFHHKSMEFDQHIVTEFMKSKISHDDAESRYTPMIRYMRHPFTGEKTDSSFIRVRIPLYDNHLLGLIYDSDNHLVDRSIDQIPPTFRCMMVLSGSFWHRSTGFGVCWQMVQMKIVSCDVPFQGERSPPSPPFLRGGLRGDEVSLLERGVKGDEALLDDETVEELPGCASYSQGDRNPPSTPEKTVFSIDQWSESPLNEVFTSQVFRYEVAPHLSPKDLYMLHFVNRTLYKQVTYDLIKEVAIQSINRKLCRVFGDSFQSLLENAGAVVSGSLILQCLLGEEWNGSDIDIFRPTTSNMIGAETIIDRYLCQQKHSQKQVITSYNMNRKHGNCVIEHRLADGTRVQVIQFESSDKKLDFVEQSKNFIIHDFDFDVCMNLYAIRDTQEILYCHTLTGIIHKVIQCHREPSVYRLHKYHQRGYLIDHPAFMNIFNKEDSDPSSLGKM